MKIIITCNFNGVLENCLCLAGQQTEILLKRYCFTVIFQVFYEYFCCFFTSNGYFHLLQCTKQGSCVKICVEEGSIFCFVFGFLGNPFCTTFYFDFLKLVMAPLMFKIILNVLLLFLFNFKTQISFYILIDDSVTDF